MSWKDYPWCQWLSRQKTFELETVVMQKHQNPASSFCFGQCLLEEKEEDLNHLLEKEEKEEELDHHIVSYEIWTMPHEVHLDWHML
ncbi:hypothetical protein Tco_1014133 [Tanacetum coccineum]